MPHQVPLPLPWPGVSGIVIHILLHIKPFANDSFPIQAPFDNADSDTEVGLLASELSLPCPDSKTGRAAPSPYLLKSWEDADSGQTASCAHQVLFISPVLEMFVCRGGRTWGEKAYSGPTRRYLLLPTCPTDLKRIRPNSGY